LQVTADGAEALPGIGTGAIFAVSIALAVLSSLGGGVQYGLLNEILPADACLLGRSVANMSVGLSDRLGPWMRLLLACPYLAFIAHPSLPVACVACAVASVGYSATLMLQQRPPRSGSP
jgi:hypothetical protein